MKKLLVLVLTVALVFGMFACAAPAPAAEATEAPAAATEAPAAHPYSQRGQVFGQLFGKPVDVHIIVADPMHFGKAKQCITCFHSA